MWDGKRLLSGSCLDPAPVHFLGLLQLLVLCSPVIRYRMKINKQPTRMRINYTTF